MFCAAFHRSVHTGGVVGAVCKTTFHQWVIDVTTVARKHSRRETNSQKCLISSYSIFLIFWILYHLGKYMDQIMWRFEKYEQNMFEEKVKVQGLRPYILWWISVRGNTGSQWPVRMSVCTGAMFPSCVVCLQPPTSALSMDYCQSLLEFPSCAGCIFK